MAHANVSLLESVPHSQRARYGVDLIRKATPSCLRELPAPRRVLRYMLKNPSPLAVTLLLAACASPFGGTGLAPGMPRDEVLARMGQPSRVVPLPNGAQRLQYSQQPAGQYAWMVDVDATGKVMSARQVLAEREFNRIAPGEWTRADVEREFGPPARIDGVANWNGPVMTYRWKDVQGADMFYWVYLDPQGIVRRAHPGMEFRDRIFNFRF